MAYQILCGNSVELLKQITQKVDFTFLDPPFNQQKDYALHHDDMSTEQYWAMMKDICQSVFNITNKGGCIYNLNSAKLNIYFFDFFLDE
jgi:site-specific DNA-methyltransferase (adenine-specific)/modification methylase